MGSQFSAEFFGGNRQRLRELFTGKAPIVLTANGLMQKSADIPFPFQQDSNFWYLCGIDLPDAILVLDRDKDYLILPERSDYQTIFDGHVQSEELARLSGISTVLNNKDGWAQLKNRLKKAKHVATLAALPPKLDVYNFYTNPSRADLIAKIKTENPDIKLLDLRQHFTRLRMVKQPAELTAIKEAIKLTIAGFKKVRRGLGSYRFEYEIESALTNYFQKHGADHGYEPIIANGQNACALHYDANSAILDSKALTLLDVGAQVDHYTADITRTYAIKEPTKRQQRVFEAVMEVRQFALDKLKPGATIRNYEKEIEHFMGEKLRSLGLIKSIERVEVRKYFTHATSHSLGLDPHDAADYDSPLVPNMVLTVEPGIYIPKEGIGIRIEDDVLITAKGNKVLSASLPATLV